MDSKKADEDLDESEEDGIDFEEDENDSALDSSTGCESFTTSYDIPKSQIINNSIQYSNSQ